MFYSLEQKTNSKRGAKISLNELLQEKREDILCTAAKRAAFNVRVFGFVARREAEEKSDIDLLVDLEPGHSLFDLGGLLMDLQELLNHKVDIVSERGLRTHIRDRVLKDAVLL